MPSKRNRKTKNQRVNYKQPAPHLFTSPRLIDKGINRSRHASHIAALRQESGKSHPRPVSSFARMLQAAATPREGSENKAPEQQDAEDETMQLSAAPTTFRVPEQVQYQVPAPQPEPTPPPPAAKDVTSPLVLSIMFDVVVVGLSSDF